MLRAITMKLFLCYVQVNRAVSFVDHLISVLCEQRNIAYSLSEQLINLRERLLNFTGTHSCGCQFLL